MSEDLRFPIGRFNPDFEITAELRNGFVNTIENLPNAISKSVEGLNDKQIDTRYRPDGWTIRQVVHHVADSHLNAYCRFKLAMTEDFPTIRGYNEANWAELPDNKMSVSISIKILEGIHARWTELLKSMSVDNFKRKLNHPESGIWTLEKMLGMYDWHSKHHTAHINDLRKKKNW